MRELALFAGAGGGILGGHLLGWRTVCAVERDAYAAAILAQRQNDGCLDPFPIWSDVETFDGRHWRGRVDVVSGGFPCQDISVAGKGEGITGERSGLWRHFARIIGEVGPRFCLVENSPALVGRGMGVVLGDLAALGYEARWGVLSAADAIWLGGTPCLDHLRERIWIVGECADADSESIRDKPIHLNRQYGPAVAKPDGKTGPMENTNPDGPGCQRPGPAQPAGRLDEGQPAGVCAPVQNAFGTGQQESRRGECGMYQTAEGDRQANHLFDGSGNWWATEPAVGRVVDGVAHRMDRLKAIGNGQVPSVAKLAFEILSRKGA